MAAGAFIMANNFTTDPTCRALWDFPSGADFLNDSIGGQTLTNTDGVTEATVSFGPGTSALFTNSLDNWLSILNASLNSGFPLKSGDAVQKATFCFWFAPTTIYIYADIFSIGVSSTAGIIISPTGYLGNAYVQWGTGSANQQFQLSGPIVAGHVYHCAIVVDGINQVFKVRIYDETTSSLFYDGTFSPTLPLALGTAPFDIGGNEGGGLTNDGNIAEFVAFNRLLSNAEIDEIRGGTYTYQGTYPINCTTGIVLGAIANLSAVPVINAHAGIVLGASLSLRSPIPVPVVVSDEEIAVMLGASCDLQSQIPGAIAIPCTAGLYLGASLNLVSVLPKPVVIPCTAGLLLGVAAGLSGGLFIPTATPSDAPLPLSAEIPATASLLLGCNLGLASSPLIPVEIPCQAGLLLGVALMEAAEDYETWVLTGNAFSPSAYSGWNFNSFALYRGNYYAAGDDGLHLLGGEDQAGIPIHSGARLGPINFSTDRQKRLRSMRLGATGDAVQVRIAGENGEGYFEKQGDRVVVSRNLQSHDFLIDIQEFEELSFIEIVPLILATK